MTAKGLAEPTYDARGNMTSDGVNSFAYSSKNLMTSQTVGADAPSYLRKGTFGYDPLMRL